MKKIHFKKNLIMILFAAWMLTGCTSVIELTSEEEDLIAEYAAGSVIDAYWEDKNKFNTSGNSTSILPLVTEAPTTDNIKGPESQNTQNVTQPADSVTVETTAPTTVGTSTDSTNDLVQALGITGVEVTQLQYYVVDKYPEDMYAFTVDAASGKKLLVVEYDVWNSVDAPATMTVNTEGVVIKAVINGSKKVNVHKTLLNNDIMNMNEKSFDAGQAETGVLIFMINEDDAADITSVNIEITK